MKSPYVRELEPEKAFTTTFVVRSKEIRQKKSGDPYMSLMLADRSGEVDAKMWDNVAEVMDTFGRDDFVRVKGLFQIFHNRPQVVVHKIQRVDGREVEFADYFPASERDPEEMWTELRGVVGAIGNSDLKRLLEALLDDEQIARRYRIAPAAKQIHHAFLGGLLQHVLSLCGLCRMAAAHYPWIDLDLLLTGAVLHDIGKIYELSYDRTFGYTTEGQLLGHLIIGLRLVAEKLEKMPDFPVSLRMLVEHMIISHHGKLEFGSPKIPQFAEALLLHYLDDLDSKMESMRALVAADSIPENVFTGYSQSLERTVLKKEQFLSAKPRDAAPRPAEQPAPAPKASNTLDDVLEKFNSLKPAPVK